jgi:hypothetical protein
MFLQDFVRVDRPLAAVIVGFERDVVPRLGVLVRDAWLAESDFGALGDPTGEIPPVPVEVGPRRKRPDGVVYSLAWPARASLALPEFDADLELAALSPTRTHLELSGQSRFLSVEPWSDDDRRANRRGMAAVAGMLVAIATVIDRGVPSRSGPAI